MPLLSGRESMEFTSMRSQDLGQGQASAGVHQGAYSRRQDFAMESEGKPEIHSYEADLAVPTEKNIYDAVAKGLRKHPDKKILINGVTQESLTGQKILDLTTQLSNGLRKRGFQKGDTLCICLQNDLYYPVLLLAAFRNGGIATTANPGLTAAELKKQLSDSRPKFLFYSDVNATAMKELLEELDFIQESFLITKSDDGNQAFDALLQEGANESDAAPVEIGDDDIAFLPYSSGTTGLPKGVQLPHRSLIYAIAANKHASILDVTPEEVFLAFLPFFHMFGCAVLLTCLSEGCTLVLMPKFNFGQFLTIIQEFKVNATPKLKIHTRRVSVTEKTLIIVGAAPLSAALEMKLGEVVPHADIRQGYGMTESPLGTHCTPKGKNKPGSCGMVVPFYQSKVVDDCGNLLPAGEHGNICVRGPQASALHSLTQQSQ
ncbi:unnamed protein product [Cyprideis torosa]|uniref:AMP-dependent synthetase/ligase domain-containing protein n=1 Tax=Cyprideis torosa TaxID=163714 RepID=A0A7R8W3Y7_9CRUS|nr:unnamed protein product [Cyprideis torosa]CAG0880103.1 unnamed protein product [Cyprideis torosa]